MSETHPDPEMELLQKNCSGPMIRPEELAKFFHDEYERIAPHFGYKTREASAKPWNEVPEQNRRLMEAVAASVLMNLFPAHMSIPEQPFEPVQ